MAPTPFSAGGRMVFQITISGVLHELHYACQPVVDAGFDGGYGLVGNDVGATHVDPQLAAEGWWSAVDGLYPNDIEPPGWVLEQNFAGVFVPVASDNVTTSGTVAGGSVLASVLELTFKDTSNKHVRLTFPESCLAVPYRSLLISDASVVGLIAASVIAQEFTTPSIGSWMRSRGNGEVALSRFASGTISKRLRRIRNFL